jgi:hypothetical protein
MELTGASSGGLEVVRGDGIDKQLLQLCLVLPLLRLRGIPASALLDQLEDAGRVASST